MHFLRSIFLCFFVAGFASAALGQGKTYRDGTVSRYAPGFFGVGIPQPATSSRVFGVAADGGKFLGAVGQINGLDDSSGQQPALFGPGGSFHGLPRQDGFTNGGTASQISADGKIKVGDGGDRGGYWDANNQFHPLPLGATDAYSQALAITPDGSLIAGTVYSATGVPDEYEYEAALWTPGGTGLTRLGKLPGFQFSIATGISDDGKYVCGKAVKFDNSTSPPTYSVRAFVRSDAGMQSLGTLGGNQDTAAYGISEFGTEIVGESGPAGATKGFHWSASIGLRGLEGADSRSGGLAVRSLTQSPIEEFLGSDNYSGRIVGYTGSIETGDTAFMWNFFGRRVGSIQALLTNRYDDREAWREDFDFAAGIRDQQ